MKNQVKETPAGAFWMSASDLARRYSVGVITIWKWAAKPDFPAAVRFTGKCTRWALSDIEKWENRMKDEQQYKEAA